MRKVVLHKGEDNYIVAECPSLPGCISQGQTRGEALDNIKEAITLYLHSLIQQGEPIPTDEVELVEV